MTIGDGTFLTPADLELNVTPELQPKGGRMPGPIPPRRKGTDWSPSFGDNEGKGDAGDRDAENKKEQDADRKANEDTKKQLLKGADSYKHSADGWDAQAKENFHTAKILFETANAVKGEHPTPRAFAAGAAAVGFATFYGALGLIDKGVAAAIKFQASDYSSEIRDNFRDFEPVIFDLNHDGRLIAGSILFDVNSNGHLQSMSWVGPGDGVLVFDVNGNNEVDGGSELLFRGLAGQTDLDRLVAFDSNHDGVFDSADADWTKFKIWQDANSSGHVDDGELHLLSDFGITSINLAASPVAASGADTFYWHDANQDGLIDSGEVYDAADAPAGSIPVQRVDGGYVLQSTNVTTTGGDLTAYSVALDLEPGSGVSVTATDTDAIVTYDDGRIETWHIVTETTGVTIDLNAAHYTAVFGGSGDDTLFTSGAARVILSGGEGNDTLTGGAGDDTLDGGTGADWLDGGAGDDAISFDAADLAVGVDGGEGHDRGVVESADAINIDLGATHLEVLLSNDGNDVVTAGTAQDVSVSGGAGDDTITGGSGDDFLSGDVGADSLSGGAGNDTLIVDADDIVIAGGDGIDAVLVNDTRGVTLDLTAAAVEIAHGGSGDDVFDASGSTAMVVLDGRDGNDTLTGGLGSDRLTGGGGNDQIVGGGGRDAAFFSGNAADYLIVGNATSATVSDLNAADGSDGNDTLAGISLLVFNDTTIHLDGNNSDPLVSGETWRVGTVADGNTFSARGLLNNDWDPDRDILQVSAIGGAHNGDVSINKAGEVTFKADDAFAGNASFDYLVTDGHGGSAVATSHLQVFQALPNDEFFSLQWGLAWLNVYHVWDDYTGAGIKVAIQDSGVDPTHPDIAPNYDPNLDDDPGVEPHGTFTTGLVGAARNGIGIVGIAYDATITTNTLPDLLTWYDDFSNFDVVNNSWASRFTLMRGSDPGYTGQIKSDVDNGRDGLGTITVFAGGNEREIGDDTNLYAEQSSRYVITVASIQESGEFSDFSNPGASILVSAAGTNIASDDITGPSGFADDTGLLGADYALESGTSASAPMVAAVAALMLQANPNLGWRDVQEILAYSAVNSDPGSAGWSINAAIDWNGGGLHVNRDYGFGAVDALAAVRLAETWQKQSTSHNEISVSHSAYVGAAIPDNGGAVSSTIHVDEDIRINHVAVTLNFDHANVGDLVVELVAPGGTDSVLLQRLGVDPGSTTDSGAGAAHVDWTFTTTHDWGESSVGDWTLRVRDVVTGNVGTVNYWSLQVYGDTASVNNTYIYTDEFGALTSGVDIARHTLSDTSGRDAINAAAVTSSTMLDLHAGATSSVAGASLTIAAGTQIEDAYLGDGNDSVIGNDSDSYLFGGRGEDTLEGGVGADTLDGGRGEDTASYVGSANGVTVDLAAGTGSGGDAEGDALSNIENIRGSAFDDTLTGDANANFLAGGAGDDVLAGNAGDDSLNGGEGDDHLSGGGNDDTLIGGDGSDIIDGGAGIDTAVFAGLSTGYSINNAGGAITVSSADGSDTLTNVEFLRFADGTFYTGSANQDPIAVSRAFTLTQRTPFTISRDDLLAGASDADGDPVSLAFVYRSLDGVVTLTQQGDVRFTVDPDFIGTATFDFTVSDGRTGEGNASLSFIVAPTFTFNGTESSDTFLGLGSADTAYGGAGDDTLDGGFGDDVLYGEAGSDQLIGRAGADQLHGGDGDDALTGGAGADQLDGGAGTDTASYASAARAVAVDLAAGMGTGGEAAGDTLSNVENLTGSAFADTLAGDSAVNVLGGLAGTDRLLGLDGDDHLFGGDGDDTLTGGAGADTLDGGDGTDIVSYLTAGGGVSINLRTGVTSGFPDATGDVFVSIEGVEGSTFDDQLTGDQGDNILFGAAGADVLTGDSGSDTYVYRANGGDDRIVEAVSPGDTDRLVLGTGLVSWKASVERFISDALPTGPGAGGFNGANFAILSFDGSTGSIEIDNEFEFSNAYGVEEIVFADGVVWSRDELRDAYLFQHETSANDTVHGFDRRDDIIIGLDGDDTLYGYGGSDTYVFDAGDGNDVILEGGSATDTDKLVFGEGLESTNVIVTRSASDSPDVTLSFSGFSGSVELLFQFVGDPGVNAIGFGPGFGVEEIDFADGVTWSKEKLFQVAASVTATAGADTLYGAGGFDDTLQGLAGDDTLVGDSGSDTYVYDAGDGNDTIIETAGAGYTDRVVLGSGITLADVSVSRSGTNPADAILEFAGGGSILLKVQFANTAGSGIEQVVFADGTVLTRNDLQTAAIESARTAGADTIRGFDGRADLLDGGAGNDQLFGLTGGDTYAVAADGGDDQIFEGIDLNAVDRLVLGTGLNPADLVAMRSGSDPSDMLLHFNGHSGSILLHGEFNVESRSGVEQVVFGDGTIWSTGDLLKAFAATDATSGNDTLTGANDRRDYLHGLAGNDVLIGGSGGDTYYWDVGDGNDTIDEHTGFILDRDAYDRLILGPGLQSANATIERDLADFSTAVLRFSGAAGSIRLSEQFTDGAEQKLDSIVFVDGSAWDQDTIRKVYLQDAATAGDDVIIGFDDTGDRMSGGHGNDVLEGGGGNDRYVFNAGDGRDFILDTGGTGDELIFGAGIASSMVTVTVTDLGQVIIDIAGSSDRLMFADGDIFGNPGMPIEKVTFADGTQWSGDDVLARATELPVVFATDDGGSKIADHDVADGLSAIDWGFGFSQPHILNLHGISPDDVVLEQIGDGSRYYFIDGQSFYFIGSATTGGGIIAYDYDGSPPVDGIVFDDGTVWDAAAVNQHFIDQQEEAGTPFIQGFFGDDTIEALPGNNLLIGGGGNDTYIYRAGDGDDRIDDRNSPDFSNPNDYGTDQLVFPDIASEDVHFARAGNGNADLVIEIGGAAPAQLTIVGQFRDRSDLRDHAIEQFQFSDATLSAVDVAQIILAQSMTDGDDVIVGFLGDDLIAGGLGDDSLDGGGGRDTYVWAVGDGRDTIVNTEYEDAKLDILVLHGVAPDDLAVTRSSSNPNTLELRVGGSTSEAVVLTNQTSNFFADHIGTVVFDDGTVWKAPDLVLAADGGYGTEVTISGTAASEFISGTSGNDVIDGGAGDDTINGSTGSDLILWGVGSGNDSLEEFGFQLWRDADTLRLVGLNPDDVTISRDHRELIIEINSTGERFSAPDQFDFSALFPSNGVLGIERIEFADGSVLDYEQIHTLAIYRGTAGDDFISGTNEGETFAGFGGADSISGNGGSDTYLWSPGDGNDSISEFNSSDVDTLRLQNVDPADVLLAWSFSDLEVRVGDETIRVLNQHFGTGYGVERIVFDDGTTWTNTEINELAAILGTDNDDFLFGTSQDDRFIGGLGDDFLLGFDGSDTYVYALGDGNDEIDDEAFAPTDQDTLELTDLAPADVAVSVDDQGNLIVQIMPSGEQIVVDYQFREALFPGEGSPTDGIEQIRFADGTTWDRNEIETAAGFVPPQPFIIGTEEADELHGDFGQNLILGLGGDDLIFGAGGDDTIDGGSGNDALHGDNGDDVFVATAGDGNDSIDGGDGYDIADYGNITSPINVDLGLGTVTGADIGMDTLANIEAVQGGSGDDTLTGSAVYDELYGGDGNDILVAVGGLDFGDYLEGNDGDDLYVVGIGAKDVGISDWGGISDVDVLSFGAGIAPKDVTISREDDDHVLLSIGDGEDSVFLINQLVRPGRAVEEIHFVDGTVWTGADVREQVIAGDVSEDDDEIIGTGYADEIHAGAGDDFIDGLDGANVLDGGAGDDGMYGAWGEADMFVLTGNFGHDEIFNFEPNGFDEFENAVPLDIIRFDNTVFSSFEDVMAAAVQDAFDVLITVDGDRSVRLDWTDLEDLQAENFVFANPQVVGSYGADELIGSAADEVILGLAGNDVIATGGGSDAVDGGSGTDTLVLTGNRGDYAIAYDAGTQSYTVADQRVGAPDGVAAVRHVEFYQFADQTVAAANLLGGGGNAAPTDITLSGGTVAENSAAGTVVATLAPVDPDAGDSFTFGLIGGATDLFAIDGNQIVVAPGTVLDYESAASYDVTVRVTDAGGLTFDKTFTIALSNVNEAPTNATLLGGAVAENAANGTTVGTVNGSDPDAGATLSYALLDDAGGRFAIAASSGAITVANGSLLDFESAASHQIAVRVTDQGGLTFDKTFTIAISNVNEAPTSSTLVGGSVAENAANSTSVGTVTGADPDAGAVLSYALVDNAGGRFAIGAATGAITVANGSLLDFESGASHAITVRVTDQGGLTFDKTFAIAVSNINEAPTNATLAGGTVAENSANGTSVGTVTGSDPDAEATLYYSLADNAGGRFAIGSSSGAITVANGSLLDFESATSHSITVRVTDQGGLTFDKAFTINLSNVAGVTLTGTAGANTLTGTSEDDTLIGLGGNDTLNGAGAPDVMSGGTGNDTYYVDDIGDTVIENLGEGTDTVRASLATYTLTPNTENLIGTAATGQTLTGNALVNAITGSSGNDTLDGAEGNDTLTGGDGVDTLYGGDGNDTLTGGNGADVLYGGTGNDTLTGGADADTLAGGLGNDIYNVDDASDVVVENVGEGTDTVKTSLASYTLADNVENLTGTALTGQTLTGNDLANSITGTGANDTLNGGLGNDTLNGGLGNDTLFGGEGNDTMTGGAGADSMSGGLGNDTYTVDDGGDVVIESTGEGTDTVKTSLASYMLGDEVERLTGTATTGQILTGNALANIITGDDGNDVLVGGDGNDTLTGGLGADAMSGGTGNDTYTVDDAGDTMTELPGEGTDTVKTSLATYTLGEDVENLTGTATTGQTLIGNALGNSITASSGNDTLIGGLGNDTLNGGAGADAMVGGTGNDTYTVDNAGDTVTELLGEGTDTAKTSLASYTLGDNVDNLTGTLATGQTLTGNADANTITGAAGNDAIGGGGGNDTLNGGLGNDTLDGGDGNDTMNGGGGTDALHGGDGDDTLNGSTENDVLEGGTGNDKLTGSAGDDTFVFGSGFGKDTVTDFVAGAGSNDVLEFHDGLFADAAAVLAAATTSGSNTVITVDATTTITLQHVALANLTLNDFHIV